MIDPIYKWRIRKDDEVTLYDVKPVWKGDLCLEYAAESGEQFMRAGLSERIDFVGRDYDRIMGFFTSSFSATVHVFLRKSDNNGRSYEGYWHGMFHITDCTINVDDKRINVQPQVVDRYTDILNGMDKEYDLIKLTPEIQSLVVRKRPMIQIYTSGDQTANCFVGEQAFEQDASVPSDVDNEQNYMVDWCHFSVVKDSTELNFVNPPTGFGQPFTGMLQDGEYLDNSIGTYRIKYYEEFEFIPGLDHGSDWYVYTNGLKVYAANDLTTVLWQYEQEHRHYSFSDYQPLPIEIELESLQTGVDNLTCIRHSFNVYMRIVTNVQALQDRPTEQIPSNDLVLENRNYRYATGYYGYTNEIVQSSDYSVTPTEWGRRDDGTYFVRPSANALPIGRSTWVNTSLWFVPSTFSRQLDEDGTDAYLLKDAFPIASVIKVILQQFCGVTFEATTAYSQFLFSGSDPIDGRDLALYLTPKSNITAGEYQTPAQKAPITLRSVLTMLKNTFQLYWHIDDLGRLRIEHVKFYRNGQSYSTTPGVGIDLTALSVARGGKRWSFGTNEYSFDRIDMPARYQFSWMDDVTLAFKGNPIEVNSPFVQADRVEDIVVGDYTSDIDYMLLNPSSISQDGFALMTAEDASVLDRFDFPVNSVNGLTMIGTIGSAFRGKRVRMYYALYGTPNGTVYINWIIDGEVQQSNLSIGLGALGRNIGTDYIIIPDDASGFCLSGDMTSSQVSMTPVDGIGNVNMSQLPIVSPTGLSGSLQNGRLAFWLIQNPYWMWDMPAKSVKVNGTTVTVSGVSRKKKQTVNIPVGNNDPNMLLLVRTGIGDGTIERMDINLSSRMAKTVLRYDTEQ